MKALPAILLLFLLQGCLKRDERHVNTPCSDSCMTFVVKTSTGLNSATALPNAYVELGWSRPAVPLGDPGRLIARGNTSADGFVIFHFKARAKELQGGKFYVTARKGNDYIEEQADYYFIRNYDSVVTANVHVPAKATLKLVYNNFYPADSMDFFSCQPYYLNYGFGGGSGITMKKVNGQMSNTFFMKTDGGFTRLELTGETAGDQYTYFSIMKRKNGVRTDMLDSIYIGKGQTKSYEVSY